MDESDQTSPLTLADAISDLRREIARAMDEGKDEALQFALGPVELEMQVALTLTGGAKGEVKWLVVSIGAEGGVERARTHRVKLVLTPPVDTRISNQIPKKPQ